MSTLVSIAVRDRRELTAQCLASVRERLPGFALGVWLDPLDEECHDLAWEHADIVVRLDWIAPELKPKHRVHLMRRDMARHAIRHGYDRLLNLDSDTVLSRDFKREFEWLWPEVEAHGCGALAMGGYATYEWKRLVERVPGIGAYVCTHGLGACLAFPVPGELHNVSETDVAPTSSWDTHFSRVVAGYRVLTSEVSYVRHAGKGTGMSATVHPDLEYANLAPDLR